MPDKPKYIIYEQIAFSPSARFENSMAQDAREKKLLEELTQEQGFLQKDLDEAREQLKKEGLTDKQEETIKSDVTHIRDLMKEKDRQIQDITTDEAAETAAPYFDPSNGELQRFLNTKRSTMHAPDGVHPTASNKPYSHLIKNIEKLKQEDGLYSITLTDVSHELQPAIFEYQKRGEDLSEKDREHLSLLIEAQEVRAQIALGEMVDGSRIEMLSEENIRKKFEEEGSIFPRNQIVGLSNNEVKVGVELAGHQEFMTERERSQNDIPLTIRHMHRHTDTSVTMQLIDEATKHRVIIRAVGEPLNIQQLEKVSETIAAKQERARGELAEAQIKLNSKSNSREERAKKSVQSAQKDITKAQRELQQASDGQKPRYESRLETAEKKLTEAQDALREATEAKNEKIENSLKDERRKLEVAMQSAPEEWADYFNRANGLATDKIAKRISEFSDDHQRTHIIIAKSPLLRNYDLSMSGPKWVTEPASSLATLLEESGEVTVIENSKLPAVSAEFVEQADKQMQQTAPSKPETPAQEDISNHRTAYTYEILPNGQRGGFVLIKGAELRGHNSVALDIPSDFQKLIDEYMKVDGNDLAREKTMLSKIISQIDRANVVIENNYGIAHGLQRGELVANFVKSAKESSIDIYAIGPSASTMQRIKSKSRNANQFTDGIESEMAEILNKIMNNAPDEEIILIARSNYLLPGANGQTNKEGGSTVLTRLANGGHFFDVQIMKPQERNLMQQRLKDTYDTNGDNSISLQEIGEKMKDLGITPDDVGVSNVPNRKGGNRDR